MPEEEKPCTNRLEWSQAAETKPRPSSCILCLYATFMVLHFNVFHPYVSSLCAFWPFSLFACVVTSESPEGWSWIIQTEKVRDSVDEKGVKFSWQLWPQCLLNKGLIIRGGCHLPAIGRPTNRVREDSFGQVVWRHMLFRATLKCWLRDILCQTGLTLGRR